ncbi:hypothetical protein NP233_g7862 [Leucocoprinus birnbaumii]|uniref:Uncharacterized protein n=1 Tax=Leucocoprinus birnbaumii TaxID=56174 RepID=A0AAD5VQ19_9AGAR|nr:hypothetical protein NP233_g7862 [Leucocoprinus birnbaumii]
MTAIPPTNSLGLDFNVPDAGPPAEGLPPAPGPVEVDETPTSPRSPTATEQQPPREKKKPYVNPDRVKTGGPQREKLTDEELAERMARIREQNEKIKQRRLDVAADEAAFQKTQEVERQKMERTKKIQDNVDKAREHNVRRKMDKAQNREWDSGKPATATWKNSPRKTSNAQEPAQPAPTAEGTPATDSSSPQSPVSTEQAGSGNWSRGGGGPPRGGRGRGRGRGRGGRNGPPNQRPAPVVGGAVPESTGNKEEKDEVVNTAPAAPS